MHECIRSSACAALGSEDEGSSDEESEDEEEDGEAEELQGSRGAADGRVRRRAVFSEAVVAAPSGSDSDFEEEEVEERRGPAGGRGSVSKGHELGSEEEEDEDEDGEGGRPLTCNAFTNCWHERWKAFKDTGGL